MNGTGKFCTDEEREFLTDKLDGARNTPVMALTSEMALTGRDFASMAHMGVERACHAIALKHDLPEIEGFYGCDLETGEFVTV